MHNGPIDFGEMPTQPATGNMPSPYTPFDFLNPAPRPRDANGRFIPVAPDGTTEAPIPEVNRDYVTNLLAQTGVRADQISETTRQTWGRNPDKNSINKEFFAWYQLHSTGAQQELTDRDKDLFKTAVTARTTEEYRQIESSVRSALRNIREYQNGINQTLARLGEYRERKMVLDGRSSVDLTDEVKAILQDGWYRYMPEETHRWNETHDTREKAIIFNTSKVLMRHYNAGAGVNFALDMGEYKVVYMPGRSRIEVSAWQDNVQVDDYIHPHISGGGSVCFGNAETTYINAMAEARPSKAFAALRVILCTYNDDNPFIGIEGFMEQRNPGSTADMPVSYSLYSRDAWFRDDELPDDIHENDARHTDSREDEDGDVHDMTRMRVWIQSRGSIRVGSDYFLRLSHEGRVSYRSIDSLDIRVQEWN